MWRVLRVKSTEKCKIRGSKSRIKEIYMTEIVQARWKIIGKNYPMSEEFLNIAHYKCTEVKDI